jgi:hypothetical protein
MSEDDFDLLIGTLTCRNKNFSRRTRIQMPKANPVVLSKKIKFDEAMRRAMRVPPPPSGKKAKRKVWRKKQR